jgi:signal transduction histidine kinase
MQSNLIVQALTESAKDDALVRQFIGVWPDIESILEAFSEATKLPTFVFFNNMHIFQSSLATMPPFCHAMLNSTQTRELCMGDGQLRLSGAVPYMETTRSIQMCHAGMLNERREIETGIGTLTIFFGSKKSREPEAVNRREQLIQLTAASDASLSERLRVAADTETNSTDEFDTHDLELMSAITDIVQQLINATAVFRFLSINMAHELSLTLLNLGLISREIDALMGEAEELLPSGARRERLQSIREMVFTQCRLGLYIVRNFLSHASETRYREVVRPQFQPINLVKLLDETIRLHQFHAAEKLVEFENEIKELPNIIGVDMELRRLFSNIINNAIKYSYHSIPNAQRIIRVRSKVPYDRRPGHMRFAITFENYGIGLTEEERRKIFKPGFRGKQAINEVPIGSGIGLSEAEKIMRLHMGFIKLQSKELYKDQEGVATYLTTVDLVFPYTPGREFE